MEELNNNEMKQIIADIINQEKEENDIRANVFPVTYSEYYKKHIFDKNFKLVNAIGLVCLPLYAGGYTNYEGDKIIIFLDKITKRVNIERKMARLIEVCCHELRHTFQNEYNEYSYAAVLTMMEKYLKSIPYNNDYLFEHDKYFFEIDANLYGITKSKKYLEKDYPELYVKIKEELDKKERIYKYDYMMYDASNTVDMFLKCSKIISKIKQATSISKLGFEKIEKSPALDIFLNEDSSFKNIKEIMNNEKFYEIDKRIIYAFFSSQTFLESIDFDNVEVEELSIVKKALEYTNNIYKNQEHIANVMKDDKEISVLAYLKSIKSIVLRELLLTYYYACMSVKSLNLIRKENRRINHVFDVEKHLKHVEEEINIRTKRMF